MTPKYIGPLYPLFFAFGSPIFAYGQLAKAAGRFNRTGPWRSDEMRPGYVRMSWHPTPGMSQEQGPYICKSRVVQLGLFPTIFGHLPAQVEHPECILHGGQACVYEAKWTEPPLRRHARLGLFLGALLALAIGLIAAAGVAITIALVSGFSLAGWALGRLWITQQDLDSRVKDIGDHNAALARVTQSNEQRYAELLEAKREVEKKVEQRTTRAARGDPASVRHARRDPGAGPRQDRLLQQRLARAALAAHADLRAARGPGRRSVAAGRRARGVRVDAAQRCPAAAPHQSAARSGQDRCRARWRSRRCRPICPALVPIDPERLRGRGRETKGVELELQRAGRDGAGRDRLVLDRVGDHQPGRQCAAVHHAPAARCASRSSDRGGEVSRHRLRRRRRASLRRISEKVFARFAQGDSSERMVGGTGIGLALVREAARLHGGDVRLVSELGQGFELHADLAAAARRRADDDGVASRSRATPARRCARAAGRARRVRGAGWLRPTALARRPHAPLALVVEDNPELRALHRRRARGATTACARRSTARDGLQLALRAQARRRGQRRRDAGDERLRAVPRAARARTRRARSRSCW